MSTIRWWIVRCAVAAVVGAASTSPGLAQERQFETLFGPLEVIVGGHVGLSHFSEFLEQRVSGEGERELRAQDAPTLGGTVAFSRWPLTEIRLEFDWTRTDIEFEDDSGVDSDDLDSGEGLADLHLWFGQIAVVRYVLPRQRTVVPYLTLGANMGLWSLDEDEGSELGAEDETQIRFGAAAGAGVRVRVSQEVGLRLEIDRTTLGNPFDGKNAYRVSGTTLDEPSTLNVLRVTAGLNYTL